VLAILRTAAVLRRALAAQFESVALTMAQYNVLRILRGAPQGLPTLQIRSRMLEEAAGITRLVDKLSADGLIERIRPGVDRRQVLCRITSQGLKLLDQCDGAVADAHADLLGQLNASEATELVSLLFRAMESVRDTAKKLRST